MENELSNIFSFKIFTHKTLMEDILLTNKQSSQYGLILSAQDAQMLVTAGKDALDEQDRIAIAKSATVMLIEKFMQSTYLSQTDYADTLAALLDVFYQAKEESMDLLTDSEVLDLMYNFFEHESGGSIELLQNRDMEVLCRKIRNKALGLAEDEEDEYE